MVVEQAGEVDVDQLVAVHREDIAGLGAEVGCEPDAATATETLGLARADDVGADPVQRFEKRLFLTSEAADDHPLDTDSGEPERLGRGGGIRFAAGFRTETGDVLAMNGDELVDVDFAGLLDHHRSWGAAATVTVARPPSQFGQVELTDDDLVTGFQEGGQVPYWVNCGIYALSEEALARFPKKGDHETTAFPELVAEGKLRGFRHTGTWLTVNTPKELRRADEHVSSHPEWLA